MKCRSCIRPVCLAWLLAAAGCLVPYCARSVNHLPPLDLNCNPQEVHAFCIEITRQNVPEEGIKERWKISPIPLDSSKVPSQSKVAYDFGIYSFTPNKASGPLIDTSHILTLRLYRAGFKTAEVDPSGPIEKVSWERAADAKAQETALDEIFALMPVIVPKGGPMVERTPEPGSVSKEHREALLFGANEYTRIATAMGDPKEDELKEIKARMIAKSQRLQILAATGMNRKHHR